MHLSETGKSVSVDRSEASHVAERRLRDLRALSYSDLLRRYSRDEGNEPVWEETEGPSGTRYNLKLYAFWDSSPPNLRVWVNADDGSKSAFKRPVSSTFIIAPDGTFIGE
jgi:hypothetical protein